MMMCHRVKPAVVSSAQLPKATTALQCACVAPVVGAGMRTTPIDRQVCMRYTSCIPVHESISM